MKEPFNIEEYLKKNTIKSGTYKSKDVVVNPKNPYNDTKNKK